MSATTNGKRIIARSALPFDARDDIDDRADRPEPERASLRVVVYTAVFGGYDLLKEPALQDVTCDFVCFTDAKMPKRVGSWNVIQVPAKPNMHPRMQAKQFKLISHEVFPRGRLPVSTALRAGLLRFRAYDASLWIDGSISIKGPHFVRAATQGLLSGEISLFTHPDRDCIYDEADLSVTMEKYHGQKIMEQVAHYRSLGTRRHAGLYACGIIGRREPTRAVSDQVGSYAS